MESQKRKPSPSDSPDNTETKSRRAEHAADVNDQATDPVQTNQNVILHSKHLRKVAEKLELDLKQKGIVAVLRQCEDVQSFKKMTLESCKRLYILVDSSMCAMLKNGEELYGDVKTKLKDMDDAHKDVCMVNRLAEDFHQLYFLFPSNIREKWEEEEMDKSTNIGTQNGTSHYSINIGTNTGDASVFNGETKSSEEHTFQININCVPGKNEGDRSATVEKEQDKLKDKPGVREVKVENGSVMITLTLEDKHPVTEDWIDLILKTIFDDILRECISTDEIFCVTLIHHYQVGGTKQEIVAEFQRYQKEVKSLKRKLKEMEQDRRTENNIERKQSQNGFIQRANCSRL